MKADLTSTLGNVYRRLGLYDDARPLLESALEIRRRLGDRHDEAMSLNNLGEVGRCLDFFMGKNTPQRKAFIVENLSADVL